MIASGHQIDAILELTHKPLSSEPLPKTKSTPAVTLGPALKYVV